MTNEAVKNNYSSPYALFRDRFLIELITFTGNGRTMTCKDFELKFELSRQQVQDIIRTLAMSEQTHLICSTEKGYFVAKNREEALHGFNYLSSRIDEQEKRKNNFKTKLETLFPEPKEPELFNANQL